jgi:hypothetical protein
MAAARHRCLLGGDSRSKRVAGHSEAASHHANDKEKVIGQYGNTTARAQVIFEN